MRPGDDDRSPSRSSSLECIIRPVSVWWACPFAKVPQRQWALSPSA